MAATVKVRGLGSLQRKFDRMAKRATGEQIAAALEAGALIIRNSAKAKAPYLTGTLRSSINSEARANGTRAEARVGTNIEYGPYQEFGTSQIRAQPYLRPAMDERADEARAEIVAALKELVTGK